MRPGTLSAAIVVLAGPVAVALGRGGYFDAVRLRAGIVALLLAALIVSLGRPPFPRDIPGRAALAGLAALTALTGLSIAWAPLGGPAVDDLQRLLLYLGALVCACGVLRDPGAARWAPPALAAGIVLCALYGLSERLVPGVVDLADSTAAGDRLAQPLTYWNGMGGLAAMGAVLCAGLAADPARAAAVRAAAVAAAAPLGLTVYLTFSRGAIAALAAGLAVLLVVAPDRASLRAALLVGGTAAVAALATVALPDVRSASAGSTGQGLAMLGVLVAAGLVAAGLELRGGAPGARPLPVLRPVALAALAVALVLAVGGAAGLGGGRSGGQPAPEASPTRLASIQSNRYEYWRVALAAFGERPLLGSGSGGFRVDWLRERPFKEGALDAHSLYLETAAELGLAGLLALALLLGGVVAAARRAPPSAAGAMAALATWALHAGLDWDWELPGLTLFAIVLAGWLIATTDGRGSAAASPRP